MANIKKLQDFIAKGQFTPAINQLNAFIGKVQEDISKGNIGASDGTTLINMATNLKNMLAG
jgi:hypothetical protein